jgi:antitoxin MazE
MRLELVRIGNSRGIRIPKALLEQCGMDDAVDVHVDRGRLVIERSQGVRKGWREAFRDTGGADDSLLREPGPTNEFDRDEWTW